MRVPPRPFLWWRTPIAIVTGGTTMGSDEAGSFIVVCLRKRIPRACRAGFRLLERITAWGDTVEWKLVREALPRARLLR